MSRRLAVAACALATVLAAALAGCSVPAPARPTASHAPAEPAPDLSGVSAALRPYYAQTVQWTPCAGIDRCATIAAPRDWTHPAAGKLQLSIVVQPAADGHPQGAILYNPGGPGGSGVDAVRGAAAAVVGRDLAARYDVVGFDPRGVAGSTPVDCGGSGPAQALEFGVPTAAPGTARRAQQAAVQGRAYAAACKAHDGALLPDINTTFAARDMDLIRGVLGQRTLTYLGDSWGTFLGAVYAQLYPHRVGRFVLDGAMDPASTGPVAVAQQVIAQQQTLREFVADCLTVDGCPFHGDVDAGMAQLGELAAHVDAHPLRAADGRMLGAAMLLNTVAGAVGTPVQSMLPRALAAVTRGDASAFMAVIAFLQAPSARQSRANFLAANSAYACADLDPPADAAQQAAADAMVREKAPTLAPYQDFPPDPCGGWPRPAATVPPVLDAVGAAPIIVIGSTGDPATPYAWAAALAKQLDSGVLVTREGQGHTGFLKGNACVDDTVDAYLLHGAVPRGGIRCAADGTRVGG